MHAARFVSAPRFGLGLRPAAARSHSTIIMAAKRVLVPIGTGSEEMEAIIAVDVLRRAGAEVTVASVEDSDTVVCSRGVVIVADKKIDDCAAEHYDLIALPGGMPGAERLRDSQTLIDMLDRQAAAGKPHAAICATPAVALQPHGFLDGKKATAHPAFVDKLADGSAAEIRVVADGVLTTSRGPGTAFEFALALVKQLYGEEKMVEVAGPMVMYAGWKEAVDGSGR
jgi:4-methyl-5(b-hydroxyethyl)-thiazole monophosphate biosynthesis